MRIFWLRFSIFIFHSQINLRFIYTQYTRNVDFCKLQQVVYFVKFVNIFVKINKNKSMSIYCGTIKTKRVLFIRNTQLYFVEGYIEFSFCLFLFLLTSPFVRRNIEFSELALALLASNQGLKEMGLLRISPLYHNPVLTERGVLIKWHMACMTYSKGCSETLFKEKHGVCDPMSELTSSYLIVNSVVLLVEHICVCLLISKTTNRKRDHGEGGGKG